MNVKFLILLAFCVFLISILLVSMTPAFDGLKRLVELEIYGRLTVPGLPPQIIAVYLENNPCDEPGGINKPPVIPIANSDRTIRFNATVYDVNGDCNGTATFYICANETAVAPTYCDENYDVTFVNVPTPYAQYGGAKGNLYCNYTATYNLPYFRRCGNWYVNVTVSDTSDMSNSTVRWWKDDALPGVWYPYVNGVPGDAIYIGQVVLDQWNVGGQNTTRNIGNVNITSLQWNATNFTFGSDVIPILPLGGDTTFAVDDDTNRANGAGYISENPSVQISFPSYGMDRCEDSACLTTPKAMYYLYWHLYVPPPPLSPGEYTNVIQLNSTQMSCE